MINLQKIWIMFYISMNYDKVCRCICLTSLRTDLSLFWLDINRHQHFTVLLFCTMDFMNTSIVYIIDLHNRFYSWFFLVAVDWLIDECFMSYRQKWLVSSVPQSKTSLIASWALQLNIRLGVFIFTQCLT